MKLKHAVLLVAMAGMTVFGFLVPDAALFREPSLARMIFWHLPSAFLSMWFLFHMAYLGVRYLIDRNLKWDVKLGAAVELGAVFGLLTMVTGIFFSQAQWGQWWSWDPRQTSYLLVLFLFGLGVALRGGFEDEKRRAAMSSAYSIVSLLPAMFLTLVFPKLEQVKKMSLHPSETIQNGWLVGPYAFGVWGMLAVLAFVVAELYSQRVRAGLLALKLEESYGLDQTGRSRTTPSGVVRPVGVHEEN